MFLNNRKLKLNTKLENEKAVFYKRQLYYCRMLCSKTLSEFSELTKLPISTISCYERNKSTLTQKSIKKIETLFVSDKISIYNFNLFENKIDELINSLVKAKKLEKSLADPKDHDILNNTIFNSFYYLSNLNLTDALLILSKGDYTKPDFSPKYYEVYQLISALTMFVSGNVKDCTIVLENRVASAEDKRVEAMFMLLKVLTKFCEKKHIHSNEIDDLEVYFSALNSPILSGIMDSVRLIKNLKFQDKTTFENNVKNILKCKFSNNKIVGAFFGLYTQIYHSVFIPDLFFKSYIKFENRLVRLFFETIYYIYERKIEAISHNINEFLKHKIPDNFLISKLMQFGQKLLLYRDAPDVFIKYFLEFLDTEISRVYITFFILLACNYYKNIKGGNIILKLIKLNNKLTKILPQAEYF